MLMVCLVFNVASFCFFISIPKFELFINFFFFEMSSSSLLKPCAYLFLPTMSVLIQMLFLIQLKTASFNSPSQIEMENCFLFEER